MGDVYNQYGRGHGTMVTAAAERMHGDVVFEAGRPGIVVKQSIPGPDVPRADQQKVRAGEAYVQLTTGLCEVPDRAKGDISAARKGDMIYIARADSRLALDDGGGANVPLGRVYWTPGENGRPANTYTVDMDAKV